MRTLRAGGSLLILALFPALVLGLIAGLAWLVYWAIAGSHGLAGAKLLLVVVPFAYAVFVAVREVLAARPQPASGHEVPRSAHPRLWAAADDAARSVGTDPAERLVVVPDVNAAVTQAAGRRELLVGLPLLATLTTGELRSVLAHEFGHFGAGHTRLTALTWRGRALMHEVAQRTDGALGWVIRQYARFAGRLTAASSRDQEWAADEYAARLTDPATAASALRKVVRTDLAMQAYLQSHMQLAGAAARRAPIAMGLVETMHGRRDDLATAADKVLRSPSADSSIDTHPPTAARIAAFEKAVSGGRPDAAGDEPAYELLDGGLTAFDPIELALTGDEDPVASWDEVVEIAGRELTTQRLAAYLERTPLGSTIRSVGDVIDAAPRPDTRAALAPLLAPEVPQHEREGAVERMVVDFAATAIAAALISTGTARFVVDWGELWRLVTPDGHEVLLRDRVAAAVADSAAVHDLAAHVHGLGLDLSTPVPRPGPVAERAEGAVSGG